MLPTSKTLDRKQLYCKMTSCDLTEPEEMHTVSTKLNSVANLCMRRVRENRGRFGSLQVESDVYRIRLY